MRWRPYVPVHQRKANGLKQAQRKIGKGNSLQPIRVEGRKIATTFWGRSWCEHLEDFSDFSNRLPRGRTYARNGSIVHLEISTGKIAAMVAGSDLYQIQIKIDKMSTKAWQRLCQQCASSVTSTIDLLRGKLPEPVLNTLTDPDNDLFPRSSEIHLNCNCPDWADLCKHLAAVLYGIGSRLDDSPELLFLLRGVDPGDLIGSTLAETTDMTTTLPGAQQLDAGSGLEDLFGIELIDTPASTKTACPKDSSKAKKKSAAKSTAESVKKKAKKKSASKKRKKKAAGSQELSGVKKKKATQKKALKKKTTKKKTTKKKSKQFPKPAPTKKAAKKTTRKKTTKKSKKKSNAASNTKLNTRGKKT